MGRIETTSRASEGSAAGAIAGALLVVVLLGLLMTGCHGGAETVGESVRSWPFRPRSLRIHPLTRFVVDGETGETLLAAHVELVDLDGIVTRGLGRLVLTVEPRAALGLPSETWTLDLDDLTLNRRYYDVVTQTYRIPLSLSWTMPTERTEMTLSAELATPDGATLRNSAQVMWR